MFFWLSLLSDLASDQASHTARMRELNTEIRVLLSLYSLNSFKRGTE